MEQNEKQQEKVKWTTEWSKGGPIYAERASRSVAPQDDNPTNRVRSASAFTRFFFSARRELGPRRLLPRPWYQELGCPRQPW